MAFSGMINLKSGLLTLGGQFDAYKRGQLERNIQVSLQVKKKKGESSKGHQKERNCYRHWMNGINKQWLKH